MKKSLLILTSILLLTGCGVDELLRVLEVKSEGIINEIVPKRYELLDTFMYTSDRYGSQMIYIIRDDAGEIVKYKSNMYYDVTNYHTGELDYDYIEIRELEEDTEFKGDIYKRGLYAIDIYYKQKGSNETTN